MLHICIIISKMSNLKVAVVGAGVVGLTTALELQDQINGVEVNILAENFYEKTTSYVAAGLFRPGTNFSGPTEAITKQWIRDAFDYYSDFLTKPEASKAGVTQVSGYIFSSGHESLVRNFYIEDVVPIYRRATEDELQLCPGNWRHGSFFTTVLTECKLFLPWAMRKFNSNGGNVIEQTIKNFSELSNYDIIINCTGLGAKYICNDNKLVPIRGQVLKVHAPWLKTFFYGDYDTYIIPGFDSVTLGGCRQYDSYDLNVNKYDSLSIMERCEALLPNLKNCKIKQQCVGLRPHRSPVRVEKETYVTENNKLKLVHNYGHGGYGVTTAPGTAKHAVKLVKELWMGNSKL